MKTITFALQKGGTGKTSIPVSTAVQLAENGKKVLMLDADPQGNATTWLGIDTISVELADVLMKKLPAKDAIIKTQVENLSIIPTASLNSDLRLYSKTLATQQPFIIKHICREVKEDLDFLVIDTSPSFGALEESCLLASSDEAVTVLNIDEFSSDGLITFMQNIDSLKDRYDTDKPKMNKIILNSRDLRLVQQADYLEKIKSATDSKLYIVPVDQGFRKAQTVHIPLQYLEGVKKETLSVICELCKDLERE
ncbi:ParA family protein [Treponema pectinovorum]|uniref:ParA family protein n=1 Tax=Treponema pectinovorum TaxID=164 RepID=UPI0011C8EAE3|nr:AAA family ATPase [Treponema pectinovorum]